MINEFLEEAKKKTEGKKLSPEMEEIHKFANDVFQNLKGGSSRKWVWTAATLFIKSIDSKISKEELIKGVGVIDGMILTTLADFISEGILIKRERKE